MSNASETIFVTNGPPSRPEGPQFAFLLFLEFKIVCGSNPRRGTDALQTCRHGSPRLGPPKERAAFGDLEAELREKVQRRLIRQRDVHLGQRHSFLGEVVQRLGHEVVG